MLVPVRINRSVRLLSLRRAVLTTKKRKWYVGSPIYVTIVAVPAVTGVVGGLVRATWVQPATRDIRERKDNGVFLFAHHGRYYPLLIPVRPVELSLQILTEFYAVEAAQVKTRSRRLV